jgi:hypothetical protein
MPLPKLNVPMFELNLPSNEKKVRFRPFLVKEQKILMMALESDDQVATLNAVKQIVNNCAVDEIEVDDLPMFDLEYFFVRVRSKSIGEVVELTMRHPTGMNSKGEQCSHGTNFKLNLLDVDVQRAIAHETKILIEEETGTGISFKYPTSTMIIEAQKEYKDKPDDEKDSQIDIAIKAIIDCIDYVYDKENIYKKDDFSKKELVEFIDGLSQEQFLKLTQFFDTMPKLKHTVKWKCAGCGCEDSFDMEGLANFFV